MDTEDFVMFAENTYWRLVLSCGSKIYIFAEDADDLAEIFVSPRYSFYNHCEIVSYEKASYLRLRQDGHPYQVLVDDIMMLTGITS